MSAAIITCPWCGDEIRFISRHTAAQDLGHHLAEECVSPADDGAPEAECAFCTTHLTFRLGEWMDDCYRSACTDTSAPFVAHKPKED